MRIIYGVIMLLCALSAYATSEEQAVTYYNEAREAFNNDELAKSEAFIHKALAIVSRDGTLYTNTREVFKRVLVGRRTVREVHQYGDPNTYAPNKLLAQINTVKAQQLALAQKQMKLAKPPQLNIHSVILSDEDDNAVLTALEDGTLSFVVVNTGESTAENIKINIDCLTDHIPDLSGEISIGNLASGEMKSIYRSYRAPKSLSTRFKKIHVSATEFDGLGNTEQMINIQSRPYFSPVITATLLTERSDTITTQKPTTLYYEIKNTGAEVARDINLALDFDLADTVRIIKNIDTPKISHLRVGETKVVNFRLQALKASDNIGLNLKSSFRGANTHKKSLALASTRSFSNTRNSANQYLANINTLATQDITVTNPHSLGIIIDLASTTAKQVNNASSMHRSFTQSLKIAPHNIQVHHFKTKQAWHDYFSQELPTTLKKSNKLNKINQVNIYISGQGHFNSFTNQASLKINNNNNALINQVALTPWLKALSKLRLAQINIYLEVPFVAPKTINSGWVLQQNLVAVPATNINIYSAALPKQKTNALTDKSIGIFTHALTKALSGNADTNQNAVITPQELQQFITQEVKRFCESYGYERQYPWSLLQSALPLIEKEQKTNKHLINKE